MTLRLVKRRDPPLAEKIGLDGMLSFRTRPVDGHGRIEHTGRARLVDAGEGIFLFVDLDTGLEVCLHLDEILSFSSPGAS